MHIQVISIFPAMFEAITAYGVTGRAHQQGLWQLDVINPRDYADNHLGYIDDRPFGGGPGMLMQALPLQRAIDQAQKVANAAPLLYLSPQGAPLTQASVNKWAQHPGLILLCGRYEGIDERLLQANAIEEVAIGDFVVSGGELPAMMLMDAVIRQLPGTLGDARSSQEDSFSEGLLDYPHYTRPADFCGMAVPDVLLSGNHAAIARWRKKQSLARTLSRRPDLLAHRMLNPQEVELLNEIQQEQSTNPYQNRK